MQRLWANSLRSESQEQEMRENHKKTGSGARYALESQDFERENPDAQRRADHRGEGFLEFLRHRRHDRELARAAATASSPALEAIWNNPEDDVYDAV
jgi:hypothetical protein